MKGYGKMLGKIQKMQKEMEKIEAELAEEKVEASAGGGGIKATVNGKQELLSVKISPEAVEAGDIQMLQDMVIAAVNEAIRKSKDLAEQKLSRLTGGLGVPGLM